MVHYEPLLYTVRSSQVSESHVLVGQLHVVKQKEAIDSTASQANEPVRMCSNKEVGVAHFADNTASAHSKQGTALSTSFRMGGFKGNLQIRKQLDGTAMRY
jgi:lipopolysaccharide biosynthesis protein